MPPGPGFCPLEHRIRLKTRELWHALSEVQFIKRQPRIYVDLYHLGSDVWRNSCRDSAPKLQWQPLLNTLVPPHYLILEIYDNRFLGAPNFPTIA